MGGEVFGWLKTFAGGRRLHYYGVAHNGPWVGMVLTAYDLMRMSKLTPLPSAPRAAARPRVARRANRPFRRHAESPYHACVGTVQACPEPVEGGTPNARAPARRPASPIYE